MQNYLEILRRTSLFKTFTEKEATRLLTLLKPKIMHYDVGETLLMAGFENDNIGIVLNGKIEAYKPTKTGEHFIVSHLVAGGVYGDVLSAGHSKSPVTVSALTPCTVLSFSYPALMQQQTEAALRLKFVGNLVNVISDKYFALDGRISLLLTHGLRRRIAKYLLAIHQKEKSHTFQVPLTRAQLANYLGCERSALCREISRMAKEGLLETYKSSFRLLSVQGLQNFL